MNGRAAIALAVANLIAGVLNYLFQVHAAAVLDAAAFGLLSAWFAQVTVGTAVATILQFVSLDSPIADARFERLARAAGIVCLAILVALLLGGYGAPGLVLGAAVVLGSAVAFALIGQLQARLRLGDVGALVLAMSVLRFGLPFAWKAEARANAFYVAHAATAYAGIVLGAVLLALRPPSRAAAATKPVAPPSDTRLRLGRPILLAFATLVFPLVDVLVISSTHDAQTTGIFSRIALAARIVFFGGIVVLPILLPHQLHGAKTGDPLPPFVVLIQRWLSPTMIAGALALAAILDRGLLHPQGEERIWLFATCVAAALLVAILAHVQRFAANARLGTAALCVGAVVVTRAAAAGVAALAAGSITRYVLAVLVGDVLVLTFARVKQSRT